MANKFLKELGQDYILVPYIEQWFAQEQSPNLSFKIEGRKPRVREGVYFAPSSDAHVCSRLLYAYKVGDLVKTWETSARKSMLLGHFIHEIIEGAALQLGFANENSVEVRVREDRNGWHASGRIDIAPLKVPDRKDYVVDIKSMNARDFSKSYLPSYLYNSYIPQIQLYMDWTGIPDSFLLCFEKDSPHRMKEIPVNYDNNLVSGIYNRWDIVYNAIQEGKPPPHDLCIEDGTTCQADKLYEDISD